MRPLRILNVAEKNDAAKELSRIMSRGQCLRVGRASQICKLTGLQAYNLSLWTIDLITHAELLAGIICKLSCLNALLCIYQSKSQPLICL